MENFLDGLNPAQRDAVVNTEGPALVIAGAGSGKTRVLTFRIVQLLENGVPPYKILALTFTNKAAKEMKERIAEIIGQEKAKQLWMGTFHSIFSKILRLEATNIGYPSNFTIYDASDTQSIIKSIIKELKLDDQVYKPSGVYSRISNAKNNLVTAQVYENNKSARATDDQSRRSEIYRIYQTYAKRCFASGAMDFDDLLLQTNVLFRDKPEILEKYQNKFNYLLVDEYQDTNYSQYLIVKKLAEKHNNLCVVGDDAQSIYSFRGAKIENILNFKKDYKNFKMYKLEQNYRSTQTIVNAANSIIEKNKSQIPKNVFSQNETGRKIAILGALTDNEEGFMVVSKIFDSIYTQHTEYKDHAILYRTNAQSRIFEEALRKRNIPYKIYGGTSFYQRKEIKDVLAYFRLVVNIKDNEALKRIINYPKRGIGDSTVERIEQYALENDISMWETVMNIPKIDISLNSRALNQVFGFAEMINEFRSKHDILNAFDLAREIASKSGILTDLYKDKAPESVARHENVQELLNGIKEYTIQETIDDIVTLGTYLETVTLLTNDDNEKGEDRNRVSLMTIHSSKGLEFGNVYIVGVEDKLFPSEQSIASMKDLEEERRLFYVAVTRAETQLFISFANQRYRFGQLLDCTPSRFIREIDSEYVETNFSGDDSNENEEINIDTKLNLSSKRNYFADKRNIENRVESQVKPLISNKFTPIAKSVNSKQSSDTTKIEVGTKVEHLRFGIGIVRQIEGEFPNRKASIEFKNSDIKQLLLKFAKLNVIEE